ncbi:hypothetical protein ACF08B_40775 [Streptomyces sp. NPDC015139]|uniref:hypothetical protein n=1 Tax=Streptomyces sp. NPDC015139 TaxID=3364942 RepID=UPI0036FCDDA2
MIEHTPYNEARSRPTTALQMPQQAPPVDRAEAAPAATPGDNPGLEASGRIGSWLGDLLPF